MTLYYFDTCIWLDLFEERENSLLVKDLLQKIVEDSDMILYSNIVFEELKAQGYNYSEIVILFYPLKKLLIYKNATLKQIGKAKDLAEKRNLPKRDVLHALIARDENALLITRDKHFQELKDICKSIAPKDAL